MNTLRPPKPKSSLPNGSSRILVILVVFVVAVLEMSDNQCQAEMPASYFVLSIGVGKFKYKTRAPELSGVVNDAKRVAELFQAQGRPVRVKMLLGEEATAENISGTLENLSNELKPREFVIIYLSGHGDRRGGQWSFIAHDYGSRDDSDERLREHFPDSAGVTKFRGPGIDRVTNGQIPGSLIYKQIRRLCKGGHNVLLAVDACYAGNMAEWAAVSRLGVGGDPFDLDESASDVPAPQQGGFIVLASSIPSQISLAGSDNSLFTKGLLEALRGKADWDRNGAVTLKEVKQFLSWRLNELRFRQPKMPGMEWPEQCSLSLSSIAVPETLTLTSAQNEHPLFPAPRDRFENAPDPERDSFQGEIPEGKEVGLWQIEEPVTNKDGTARVDKEGKPVLAIYSLLLLPDGGYVATHRDAFGHKQASAGRYRFEIRSYARSNFYRSVDSSRSGKPDVAKYSDFFYLEYANGYDYVKLDAFNEETMTISVYPNPSAVKGPAGKYVLKRVPNR